MNKFIFFFHFILAGSVFSQNEPKLALFSYNPLQYNPAYSGVFDGLSINSIYSTQWVGFEGAPKTLFLSAHSSVFKKEIGLGINITTDKIGPIQDNKIIGNFAYHINLNDNLKLSLGLKGGVNNFIVDYQLLSAENPEESDLTQGSITENSPVIGSGMYLSTNKVFFGISIPNILKTQFYNQFNNSIANSKPNYYFSGGYKFEINHDIFITPNFLTRVTSGAPVSTLLAVNIDYHKKLLGSLNIQPSTSLGVFLGYKFKNNITLGYAFDYSLNQFSRYNTGSSGLYINFKLEDLLSNHLGIGTL